MNLTMNKQIYPANESFEGLNGESHMSQIDPECFLVISYNKEFQKHLNMSHSQLKLVPKTADTFFTKKSSFHSMDARLLWGC